MLIEIILFVIILVFFIYQYNDIKNRVDEEDHRQYIIKKSISNVNENKLTETELVNLKNESINFLNSFYYKIHLFLNSTKVKIIIALFFASWGFVASLFFEFLIKELFFNSYDYNSEFIRFTCSALRINAMISMSFLAFMHNKKHIIQDYLFIIYVLCLFVLDEKISITNHVYIYVHKGFTSLLGCLFSLIITKIWIAKSVKSNNISFLNWKISLQ